jgi:poly-gamma-glutamate capsule biosynthesis protein CapA/YwtB (metallophosphatase superfamily)
MAGRLVTLFACGDVMPGRGIDQILPHPGDPQLREDYVRDANAYVRLAVRANGPIPRPAGFSWPWGGALPEVEATAPDARVINLETSVTRSADFDPGKAVHYRMNPGNLPCVAAIRRGVCALANNHVLDFGERGLRETLAALADAGLATAGAGLDAAEAGGSPRSRSQAAAACSSSPAAPPPAGSRRTGPRPPAGPG